MSEIAKTILFGCAAAFTVAAALALTLEAPEVTAQSQVGKKLVDIEDPAAITSLKIVRFDETRGEAKPFEVAKTKKGDYVIPSHENYPADAFQHLADAATSVNNLEILSSVGELRKSHEDFGVIDPTDNSLTVGASGVGTRVTLGDAKGQTTADFIVGGEVANRPGLRYVRRADKDQVYTVKLDPKNLSTSFEDWIEKDLLKIDPIELKRIRLTDYAVELKPEAVAGPNGLELHVEPIPNERSETELSYDQSFKWKLDRMFVFNDHKPSPVKLAPDEELNEQKLNDMKDALQDLKIADVRRKPPGLEGNLVEFAKNPVAEQSLVRCGFYPLKMEDPNTGELTFQILSDQGEARAGMNDGVEYVLRFGGIAGGQSAAEQAASLKNKGRKKSDVKPLGAKLLRYLFVMTRFNPNLLPKLVLRPVPSLEAPPAAGDKGPGGAAKTDPAAAKDAHGAKDAAQKPAAKPPQVKDAAQAEKAKLDTAKEAEARKREHDSIIRENAAAQREYDEKVAAAKKRVKKLNQQFDDWYYVIADDVYQKIHLSRADVVRKKAPKTDMKPPGPPGPMDFSLPPGLVPGGGPPGAGPGQ